MNYTSKLALVCLLMNLIGVVSVKESNALIFLFNFSMTQFIFHVMFGWSEIGRIHICLILNFLAL